MKDERIVEEMAILDGITNLCYDCDDQFHRMGMDKEGYFVSADYLHDHNAVQRVIDMMGDHVASVYFYVLWETTSKYGTLGNIVSGLKATCRQKCEAILKANGKWEI